jgi:hypothetical protein
MPPVWRFRWKRSDSVQMAEHLQRDGAHRALRHARKQELAQLGEQRGRDAQHAVRHQRAQRQHQQACGCDGVIVNASISFFITTGTPTLASLAPTRQPSASSTRHL